ncbi:MAG: hypothetical protein GC150_02190 [Rhizobiales bacterium]|nr:hypothetical protein [Hyphomicrobiales bacterium]
MTKERAFSSVRVEFDIVALGADGDGIAASDHGSVFVPFSLPGERVSASVVGARAGDVRIIRPSPDRVRPVCRHFGRCGACAVQHFAGPAYADWKRDLVVRALERAGIAGEVRPLWVAPDASRRRAALKVRRTRSGVLLGYSVARTHDIVDALECPVLEPRIVAALPGLRQMLRGLLGRSGQADVMVTAADNGLDLAITGPAGLADDIERLGELASVAGGLDIARVTIAGETVYQRAQPSVAIGRSVVPLPPAPFLQAVAAAEAVLANEVVAGLAGAGKVADLFCGVGPFALRLAEGAEVLAADQDASALVALRRAADGSSGLKPIRTLRRDLMREPLDRKALAAFDGVVIDPPRAGARAQVAEIAASGLARVVMVSCAPAAFARDAEVLVGAGFVMGPVLPVDQFRYSVHLEVVAAFRR